MRIRESGEGDRESECCEREYRPEAGVGFIKLPSLPGRGWGRVGANNGVPVVPMVELRITSGRCGSDNNRDTNPGKAVVPPTR